jgi:hypothetical protein
MALNLNNNAPATTTTKGNFEQALSFINIGLPNAAGGTSKLTMAALKASDAAEQGLHDALVADEAEVLEWVRTNMVLTFRQNTSGSKAIGFAFNKKAA